MKFPSAVRRFLLGYLVLHLVAMGIFVLVLSRMVNNQMVRDSKSRMSALTTLLAEHVDELNDGLNDPSIPHHLKKIGDSTKMRFTLITNDGVVVADSRTGVRDIGPHGNREEVLLAKSNKTGFSQRYSATLDQTMLYFARKYEPRDTQKPGGYIRVAIPDESINSAIASIQRYLWLFALALSALTAILMAIFSARSMKPLGMFSQAARRIGVGDYNFAPPLSDEKDEWGELGEAFEQMQKELNSREASLVENNLRLEAVLSSMIEGVIAIEPDGTVMLANGAACEMLSLTRPELIGRKLLEIVRNPELRKAVEKTQLDRTFSETEFKTFEAPQKTISARVSILADTRKPGVAVVLHNVTELRQLETMRQDFVANVSHELKTPLASIKAYAETLRLGAIHDEKNNLMFVEEIESSAELLNRQIQDLLQLARVESGDKSFSITSVNINLVCKGCHVQFARSASMRGVELNLDLDESNPLAKADVEAMETILNNLTVNAINYTPEGGTITISTKTLDEWVEILVTDTGIGIAPDQQGRIFERFYRVDKARSRDQGGTGLGLSIVKHLAQSFGGSVDLESQLGKGSTFRVRIPLA